MKNLNFLLFETHTNLTKIPKFQSLDVNKNKLHIRYILERIQWLPPVSFPEINHNLPYTTALYDKTFLKVHEKKNFVRRIQTLSLASFPESSQKILTGFNTLGYDISQKKNFFCHVPASLKVVRRDPSLPVFNIWHFSKEKLCEKNSNTAICQLPWK